jgi:hypothetical protein
MSLDIPGEERKPEETDSQWHDVQKDHDNKTNNPNPSSKFSFFRRQKGAKKNSRPDKDRNAASNHSQRKIHGSSNIPTRNQSDKLTIDIFDVIKNLDELRRLGLEPSSLKEFTISLHKLAVTSGVSPAILTSTIRQLNDLCDGKRMSLLQARQQIDELRSHKDALLKETEELMKKKTSLELDLGLSELEYSATKQVLAEYARIKKELEQHRLSFADISKLVTLIKDTSEQLGPNSSSIIIETITDLKSKQKKKVEIEGEIENLINSKQALQETLRTIEDEISVRSHILHSAQELEKMGFDFSELDKLQSAIKMIAQTRNIDTTIAKNQLLSDFEGYYANDHELRKRIRILESLLQEKEEKFKMLEEDYRNEKVILDYSKKLISAGFDKQWLEKLQNVIDKYGKDLDLLTRELEQQEGLKASITELQRKKSVLEEEERLLREKVVSKEDRRLRTLELIKEIMTTKAQASVARPSQAQAQLDTENYHGLSELIRSAKGNDAIIDEDKFRISARKAIDLICNRMQKNSSARVALEHAQLAMRYEDERKKHSGEQT